jgi:hypothetical protein
MSNSIECRSKLLQLQASTIFIRVCGGEAEVSISPAWDVVGRHEYIIVGKVEEVLDELKRISEEVRKAIEELQKVGEGR